jgi:hypothetical protein
MVGKSFRGGESFYEHAAFLPCDVSGALRRGVQRRQPVLRLRGSSGAVRHVKRFPTLGRLVATMARTISVAHAAAPFRCRADNTGTMIVISETGVAASHARISSLAVAMKVPGTNVQDLHLTSPAYHRTICAFSNMVQRLDSVSL